jgi:predicted ArsR family transcriptional regulator
MDKKIKKQKKWTDSEISILLKNHKSKKTSEIAKIIGRSRYAVYMKMKAIGLL